MARALKGEVRLNHAVAAIAMTGDGVKVKAPDGQRFNGAQLEAVRQSAHGNTMRVFIEHSAPFSASACCRHVFNVGQAGA
jgi:hypothetical protein